MRKSMRLILLIFVTASFLIPNTFAYGQTESGEIFQSTFFGGSAADRIRDMCLDSQGNIIVVGGTFSEDFPLREAAQGAYAGGVFDESGHMRITGEGFVAKFTPSLELVWSTYLGGSGLDEGLRVLSGIEDEVLVFGLTDSTDFPVTMGGSPMGREEGESFIARYTPDGVLIEARLYYPDELDHIDDVKIDSDGNLVMNGFTSSQTMVTTEDALQRELSGEIDGFVRVVSYDLENIVYSTYIGGSGDDYPGELALGQDDSIYIEVATSSRDFPVTENCFRGEFLGEETDNVIAKIDANRNLAFSSYIGGSDLDNIFDISPGPGDSIVIAGRSWSSDYPVTSGALQTEYSMVEVDGVLTKISESGELLYSTYYGLRGWDSLLQLDMDVEDRLVISGFVDSGGFETVNAFQSEYRGGTELIIMIMDENDEFELISYLGGYNFEHPHAQEIKDGLLYIVGQTGSTRFPVSDDAFQTTHSGSEDGYIWSMNYRAYLSGDHSDEQNSGSWYSYRDYIAYGVVVAVIVVWYLYMKRKT